MLLCRATLLALLVFCGVGNMTICTAITTQIKPDSKTKTWLENDDYNTIVYQADRRRTRQYIPCTTTSCRCKIFIWNFVSYIKFKETISQVKENTIEGLGGKRFVRVKPGSVFARWYPQLRANQLKVDGCFLCGHSFREHLEFWWWCKKRSTGGYSKFETVIGDSISDDKHYRKYVDELGVNKRTKHHKGLEVRTSFEGGISYVIPPFDPLADGKPKRVWTVLMLALARTAALVRLEDLIWLETIEFIKSESVVKG